MSPLRYERVSVPFYQKMYLTIDPNSSSFEVLVILQRYLQDEHLQI